MGFHENLSTLRKKSSLSQEQLAEILGVTRQAISKWESGQSTPDVEKLLQISDVFHVPVDQLLRTLHPLSNEPSQRIEVHFLLIYIALSILWFSGLVLIITNVFFNQGLFSVYIWFASLIMMLIVSAQ